MQKQKIIKKPIEAKNQISGNETRQKEMENCVIEYTPKKTKMTTFGRVGYIDRNGSCHVRVCLTVEKRKRIAKNRRYFYGVAPISGLNPELSGETAFIQICVPRVPADTKQFLEQPFESWPKWIETEDRETRKKIMKTSISEKVKKFSNQNARTGQIESPNCERFGNIVSNEKNAGGE
jgi:hypothetical protein